MALGSNLPAWPALVFVYIEPVTTVAGFWAAFSDPISFVARQLPISKSTATTFIPQTAVILSYSVGSLFLLLAALNVLCLSVSRDIRVSRYFLALLACADIGHIYANYRGMGPDQFWSFHEYNEVMMGNVWVTVFLFLNRVATLLGIFGRFDSKRQT